MKTTALAIVLVATAANQGRAQATDTTPASVARRQIEAFNRKDLDAFMALYADDVVVMAFPSGEVLWQGKAAIRQRYQAMFAGPAIPPVRVDPRIVDGSFVVEYELWDAKPGERNHATWMYQIRGGLIRKAWVVQM